MDKEPKESALSERQNVSKIARPTKIWEDPTAARDFRCTEVCRNFALSLFLWWGQREGDAGGKTQGHVSAQQML